MSEAFLNAASASALLSALISVLAAACVLPLGRVPDWEDLRPLPWVALSAALVAGSNVLATLEVEPEVHAWANRLQTLFLSLHVLAWHLYLPAWARRPGPTLRLLWPLPAVGLLALVPGVVYGEGIVLRPVPWLGVVYRDPQVAPLGLLAFGVVGGYALWGLVRVVRWGRDGAPYPGVHLACTGALFAMGLHDAAAVSLHVLPTPYLLDFAGYLPISLFGLMTLRRISRTATDYHRLRSGMETALVDRSRALEESRAALAQAERLSLLGQFSAGVAHELNNPATAAAASLSQLSTDLAADPRAPVRQALDEARRSMQRIVHLARQLLLAGRTAGREGPLVPVRLADALEPALAPARARARAGKGVALRLAVPSDVFVRAQRASLVQVLTNLVQSAVQAIPEDRSGVLAIRAEAYDDRVALVIEDDGPGLSEEALAHVFEPFHASRAPALGSGLGLPVARSLVEEMRGTLRLESAPGRGTRALLGLGRAEPPAPAPASAPAGPLAQASVLIIDDDPEVRASIARVLGRRHAVRVAGGVLDGLVELGRSSFDLVLCDVMMPAGGGERFWAELLLRAPRMVERVVFMTGGAASREAREFLARQPRPVLAKPFDADQVDEVLAEIGSRAPALPGGPAVTPVPLGKITRR